ncbi:hypothetical protein SAMN05216357_11084 [Porphyromonadaceae bacterium KH3CP3RA]|nr:hypothetical protein SAMN05216357_11084 [Porphyromonadaceae bacterium KH3CP3RA]
MTDYSMYKYFKGEKENPFDKEKQNAEYMFWLYEASFEKDFSGWGSHDWYYFFDGYGMGDAFMKLLRDPADYDRPSKDKKKQIFDLWLEYLFTHKLYAEYGGENWHKKEYNRITVAQ